MTTEFSTGDIVQLKSGGPAMTISSINTAFGTGEFEGYYCKWFKGACKEHANFTEETFKAYVAPAKP